jgi:hypothetical protein
MGGHAVPLKLVIGCIEAAGEFVEQVPAEPDADPGAVAASARPAS